jgi:hypothetical protein
VEGKDDIGVPCEDVIDGEARRVVDARADLLGDQAVGVDLPLLVRGGPLREHRLFEGEGANLHPAQRAVWKRPLMDGHIQGGTLIEGLALAGGGRLHYAVAAVCV